MIFNNILMNFILSKNINYNNRKIFTLNKQLLNKIISLLIFKLTIKQF